MITEPWRSPQQLLSKQKIESSRSIHENTTAQLHGFEAGTIEGSTHFSQFVPLCLQVWGEQWIERGCLSAHYEAPCYDGEKTQAHLSVDDSNVGGGLIKLTKEDDTVVFSGTASLGPNHLNTMLDQRFNRVQRVLEKKAHSQGRLTKKAMKQTIRPNFEERLSFLYPFSLSSRISLR